MIVVEAVLKLLEEHQRTPGTVAQLVLREVAGDGIDPGGEFLGGVEPMKMPGYSDECLLNQVLCPIRVSRLANDEVNEPVPITVIEVLKCTGAPLDVRSHQLLVRELGQRPKVPQLFLIQQIQVGHVGFLSEKSRPSTSL
jgi:hypothetical protein